MIFPDFQLLASAFDFNYVAINSEDKVEHKIAHCVNGVGPTLCEVFICSLEKVVPLVKFGSKVYDMDPELAREELVSFYFRLVSLIN